MDKSQKDSSSVNQKDKSSILDDDIGKDFLTSWKSMSVTQDDAMDFDFDTVSNGKKKAFNFEKLDMDFGLDGEFDKLSSFKVDMDFDLSSPSKKVTKAKEESEGKSSTGKPQGKKSQFNFFDFNEMDNFDFESSLGKVGNASTKSNCKMEISSDETEQQSSKTQVGDDSAVLDDAKMKNLPASKKVNTSDVDGLLSGSEHLIANGNNYVKNFTSKSPVSSNGGRSSPENAITNRTEARDQHTRLSEEFSMDKFSHPEKLDFPEPSCIGLDIKKSDLPDTQTQTIHQETEVHTTPEQKEQENVDIVDNSSHSETIPLKDSSPSNTTSETSKGWNNESGTDILAAQTVDSKGSAVGVIDFEGNSISSISRKASHDIADTNKNQNLTAELPSPLRCSLSESAVDQIAFTSHQKVGGLNIKSHTGEGGEHLVCQTISSETKSHSSYSERTSSMYKILETETENGLKSNEEQDGINTGGNHKLAAREKLQGEDVIFVGEKNIKPLNNLREGFTSDVSPNDCKIIGNSRLTVKEVTSRKPFMTAVDKNVKSQNPTSLSEKQQSKSNSPTSVKPKHSLSSMEFLRNAKAKSVDGNKLPLVRTKGANKPSASGLQRDTKLQQNPKNDTKVKDTAASEAGLVHKSTGKKSPPNLSLKRKAFEIPNSNLACLKPVKRISSPQGNREFQEPPRQKVEEKMSTEEKKLQPMSFLPKQSSIRDVNEPFKRFDAKESLRRVESEKVNHETQKENNGESNLSSVILPVVESHQELNLMDLEISLTMENDGIVEKAEAYAKELEDICNMLRKKHEEAKEILVRAVVNNNNLLMLNHPIYEEKIFKVQKFAAELMSKE